jgi:hypothetical protein
MNISDFGLLAPVHLTINPLAGAAGACLPSEAITPDYYAGRNEHETMN